MAMVVAIPAMPVMVPMSNFNDNLRLGGWNQRDKEHSGEKSKQGLLHNPWDAHPLSQVVT
jgi:hypothetical protein